MVDWFVLLTPLLVLAVIGLLGFTGCDLVFPLDAPPGLKFEVKVPVQLTVIEALFQYTQPGKTTQETTPELDRTDDGSGIVVLSHVLTNPAHGAWSVTCRIQVRDGTGQAGSTVVGDFTIDDSAAGTSEAIFTTLGRPGTGDFRVMFTGFVPGQA